MGEHQVKLKTVLNNILYENFKISDKQKAVIVKNVKEEANITSRLTICTNIYSNWIESTLLQWESILPRKETLIFFIDIIIEFNRNKINFVLLHQSNIFKRTIHIIEALNFLQHEDLVRAYLKFVNSFIGTEFGRNWLVGSLDCWKSILPAIDNKTFTYEFSQLFRRMFLEVMGSSELFVIDLCHIVLKPILSVTNKIAAESSNEDDLYQEISPTLDLLSSFIFHTCEHIKCKTQWMAHHNRLLCLKQTLYNLLHNVKGESFTLDISKLLISMNILELKQYHDRLREFVSAYMDSTIDIINVNVQRHFFNNVTILSYIGQYFWTHLNKLIDIGKMNLCGDFAFGLCMFQVMPIGTLGMRTLGKDLMQIVENNEIRSLFIDHIVSKINLNVMKFGYKYRNILMEKDCILTECKISIEYLLLSKDIFCKDCIILIFSILIYTMADLVSDVCKTNGIVSSIYDACILCGIISVFTAYAKENDLSWKEVIEQIEVLKTITDLLHISDLPKELIVKSLLLLDLSIDKHMAPNLTLLVDSKDSAMTSIGTLLYMKLHDPDPEIRYAASQVLLTVSENAKSKYPYFQNLLLECDLPQLLLQTIFSNEIVCVRVNGLKCLQHLVTIGSIWDVLSSRPDLIDCIINAIKVETENNIRAEVINLISAMYEEDYFSDMQVKEIHEIMTRLGIHDFDVNVRINALKFWEIVIKNMLHEEGMIDNVFPEVTFSRNSRKIVILDDQEIMRRLKRFMAKLSDFGCLNVLNSCYSSNEEPERKCVSDIVSDLMRILKQYNINETNVNISNNSTSKKKYILEDSEILSPNRFLENMLYPMVIANDDSSGFLELDMTLDEVLRNNNLTEVDTLVSYLQ